MPPRNPTIFAEAPPPIELSAILAQHNAPLPLRFCVQCGSPLKAAMIDRRERQVCAAACGYIVWDHPVPVVAVIVELPDEGVVLVRNQGWPPACFGLVSGFLEPGETAEAAALRELKEELDLDAQAISLVGIYPFAEFYQIVLVYHVMAYGSLHVDATEIAEIRLVPVAQLRPWDFAAGLGLRDWLQQRLT